MQHGDAPDSDGYGDAGRWEARNRRFGALLEQARSGDTAAFAALYDASARWLLGIVRRIVDDGQAEDVLADAFLQIWRSLPDYDASRAPAAVWMAVIARSRALDHLRRERSRRNAAADGWAMQHELVDGPEQIFSRSQQEKLVRLSVMNLDGTERLLVGLAYFRDCSYPEIARLTGLPLARVRSCMAGAQSKLRLLVRHASTPAAPGRGDSPAP